jgi:PiT family inorganic phosphate transporter
VSATIIAILSELGIPASLAVSATMCIVGLGWGRATRTTTIADAASAAIQGEESATLSTGALAAETPERTSDAGTADGGRRAERVRPIGDEESTDLTSQELFDPSATGRVVMLWILTPSLSAFASYLLFRVFPVYSG